jgi:TetR/AcrR family transcriptional regulator, ethionamide resistance regulator
MAVASGAGSRPKTPRRRRAPEDARQEILNAAAALLGERPIHEVTVAAIMERTTLSRKSFYVYFRDRSDLLSALVRSLRGEADAGLESWGGAAGSAEAGRAALRSAALTYRTHGAILRAVFWSSAEDPDLITVRRYLTDPVISVGTQAITQARPGTSPGRAHALASALVTMNVHCLLELRPDTTDAELDDLVDTLATIWERALLPHA